MFETEHKDHIALNRKQLQMELQQNVEDIIQSIRTSSADAENFMQNVSMNVRTLDDLITPTVLFLIKPVIYWSERLLQNADTLWTQKSFAAFDLNTLEDAADACANMINQTNNAAAVILQMEANVCNETRGKRREVYTAI